MSFGSLSSVSSSTKSLYFSDLSPVKKSKIGSVLINLLSNLFKQDNYPDRAATSYWFGFSYPFWFTDLLSALDSLSLLGFSKNEPQINKALKWFVENQQNDGLWELRILKGQNKDVIKLYLSLALCRVFKRFYSKVTFGWRAPLVQWSRVLSLAISVVELPAKRSYMGNASGKA